jgi:hypothetical protein
MFKRLFLTLLFSISTASAQVITTHTPVVNSSSTITAGGTYQSVFTKIQGRNGCTIQANGANTLYVFFGPIASATHAKSVVLTAGQSTNCNVGNTILIDQVSVDGTTSDTFYAAQW